MGINADKIIWTGNTLNELKDLLGGDFDVEFEEEILDQESLNFPWPISIKSVDLDTTRGDTSVDMTITFDSVDGAETYEVRFSPVDVVAPPAPGTSDYTVTMGYSAASIWNDGTVITYDPTDLEMIGLNDGNTSTTCITDIGVQPQITLHFVYSFPAGAKMKSLKFDVYGTTSVGSTEFGGYADYSSNNLTTDLTKWTGGTNLVGSGSFHFAPTITFNPGDLMDDWVNIGSAPTDIWLTMTTPYGGTQTITMAEAKMTVTYAA
jgi:hypothetical protein